VQRAKLNREESDGIRANGHLMQGSF
jgi:hypothetical protein